MSYVQLIEDGDARAFRAGDNGSAYSFRSESDGELLSAYRKAVAEALVDGALASLSEVERDMARLMADEVGIRKDATGSIYVYWQLPLDLATALTDLVTGVEGALAPEALHLTIHYLGNPAEDGSGPWDLDHVAAVCKIFSKRSWFLDGTVSGIGRFVGADDKDVLIALVDIEGLLDWRDCLEDELCWSGAVPYNSALYDPDHGYVPHITLAYVAKDASVSVKLPAPLPFKIDSLSMSAGDVSADFQFPLYENDMEEDRASFIPYYASVSGRNMDHIREPSKATVEDAFAGLSTKSTESPTEALSYAVTKSSDERRYTLGPLYAPDRKDAHGEWTDADTLQSAVWDYVRESSATGRRLNLQHGDFGDITVGEWVEVMAWPYEHEITLKQSDGTEVTQTMPAGTVYLGVVWDEAAWPEVKKGNLSGYSLGGMAVKVVDPDADLEVMGWKHAAADGAKDSKPMEPHEFEDGGNGLCKLCDKTKSAGNHTKAAAKAEPAAVEDPPVTRKQLEQLEEIARAEESRHRAEVADLRMRLEGDKGLMERMIDTVKASFGRPEGDTHIHLPEQNVTINEDGLRIDDLLATPPDG